jgi:hypothetical protein
MEPLGSSATVGNRSQLRSAARTRLEQVKPLSWGCDWLRREFNGKEEVD